MRRPNSWCVAATAVCCLSVSAEAQNSRKKIRSKPSAQASRAGTAVQWRDDFAAAQKESEESGKPVFWYVPTLQGSPMDRKPEVDRYMMAGPFSWPSTIALLNESFVPIKAPASREMQKQFGLARMSFIEPGWVVLDRDGTELGRLDKITTFERQWFELPLRKLVNARSKVAVATKVEKRFAEGAHAFDRGERDRALEIWADVAKRYPEDPLGWKAAAEVEGHGPYAFGFEVRGPLKEAAIDGSTDGSRALAGAYTEDELWKRGVEFLLRMRTGDGGIEDSRYDFGGTDSLPNVYVACTAIAGWAVLEHAIAHDDSLLPEVWSFYDYASDDENLAIDDSDELVWAHIYRGRFYCRLLDSFPEAAQVRGVREELAGVVDALSEMQTKKGAWHHEYANPFVTASALVTLRHAEERGVTVPVAVRDAGIKALLSTRGKAGGYSYSMRRRGEPGIPASIGRMALGELALDLWGQAEVKKLRAALDASFEHHQHLESVRKYDDHANRLGHGGFFFWYDMRARSEAIMRVTDKKLRAHYVKRQRDLILSLPEIDGRFMDSHELGRSYGTAMALLSLRELDG